MSGLSESKSTHIGSVRRDTKSCSASWIASVPKVDPAANLLCRSSGTLLPPTAGVVSYCLSGSKDTCSCDSQGSCKFSEPRLREVGRPAGCSGSVVAGVSGTAARL